ncbi:MAG: 2Fe-2S iron-sulfur cluster-binding protein, partial [Flavobacteriales bacterium]
MTQTLVMALLVFLGVTLLLVALLLYAKSKLVASGKVKIIINDDKVLEVNAGSSLLSTLGNEKIFLPSACGGGGTCLQCKCQIIEGGGEILPTEAPHFSRKEVKDHWRLGCQVKVKQDMKIHIHEEIL